MLLAAWRGDDESPTAASAPHDPRAELGGHALKERGAVVNLGQNVGQILVRLNVRHGNSTGVNGVLHEKVTTVHVLEVAVVHGIVSHSNGAAVVAVNGRRTVDGKTKLPQKIAKPQNLAGSSRKGN